MPKEMNLTPPLCPAPPLRSGARKGQACTGLRYAEILLRMRVRRGNVSFYYGEGQQSMRPLGGEYPMTCGGWTGARPGIFTLNTLGRWGGWADVKYVKITNL